MKKQKYKALVSGLVALVVTPLIVSTPTMAWGPERPTYTNQSPADHATFNSITDNAAVGDERDFVRIEEKDSGRPYSSEIILEAGKQYEVYIYYHNDASETYNDAAHNYAGVARDVRLSSTFPEALMANERQAVAGKITSSNASPAAVWDEAYVTAKEAMTLHYVEGSAKIYNQWGVNGSTLATALFSTEGVPLGLDELNGVILGCGAYSGQIVYTIQTQPVDTPVVPGDPELPDELPTTGPIEIALAVVVTVALVAGIVYWRKSSKAVKKATHSARGRKK